MLIACDSPTGAGSEFAEVRFLTGPADVTAGSTITPAIQVELLGADGSRVSDATVEVTVRIGANPGGGRLSGTTQVTSVGGIASFSDLSIDKSASGYTLWASLGELRDTSAAFAITPGPPDHLAFVAQPVADTARTTLAAFVIEVQDQLGNRIEGAADMVTVALGDNPGAILFHASGSGAVNRVLQYVDPLTPEVLPAISVSPQSEIAGMTRDATTGNLLAVDVGTELLQIDPLTGAVSTIGNHGVLPLRGLAWEQGGAGRLLASQPHVNELYELNPTTAVATLLGSLDIANDSVLGINGLATDPTDGTVYAIVRLRDNLDRKKRDLVTIDLNALSATRVGTLSEDGVASLAFYPNGTLYAATGDGAPNPESLWRVDKTDASMTLIVPMGDGDDGEAIACVPAHLGGTLSVAASDGVALFADLMIDAPADGYTLIATASGLTAAVSLPFSIIRP